MRNLSLKIVIFSCLSFVLVILLNSCLAPKDIDEFFKDDRVQEKIERDRVTLIDKSGDNLKVGNKQITGLKHNKYYMLKEYDHEEEFIGATFVNPKGLRSSLLNIGRVKGGAVTSLVNSHIYHVYSASPLSGELTRYDSSGIPDLTDDPPPQGIKITADSGSITIPEPQNIPYLDISSIIKKEHTYHIMSVPVSESEDAMNIRINIEKDSLIRLSRAFTLIDYIFVEYDEDKEISDFKVLSVNISGKTRPDGFKISVIFTIEDETIEIKEDFNTISISDLGELPVFELSDPDQYSSIKWNINGIDYPVESLDLNDVFINIEDCIDIELIISVEVELTEGIKNIPYTTSFVVMFTEEKEKK